VPAKFEVRIAFPIPEIIAIGVLGGVANSNLGEEKAYLYTPCPGKKRPQYSTGCGKKSNPLSYFANF